MTAPPIVTIADPTPFHAIPWFSTLEVVDVADGLPAFEVLVGPPTAAAVGWRLPVLGPAASEAQVARRWADEGYGPLLSSSTTLVRWSETALYTLTHHDNLASNPSALHITVRRPMTTAAQLLARARACRRGTRGGDGDAVHCADVLAVGQVAALQTTDQETALTVERVRVLRRPRRQQELVVRSTALAPPESESHVGACKSG
jgi:hypothetical protein